MNFWRERNGKPGGGEIGRVMKRIVLSTILVASLLPPPLGITAERQQYLEKCLELLSKGKDDEKQFALDSLPWYLKDTESGKDKEALSLVLKTLTDKNPCLREAAASSLKKLGENAKGAFRDTEIVPSLIEALNDQTSAVRREAAKALAFYKDKRSLDPLIECLSDKDPWVRLEAVHALHELRDHKAVLPLVRLLYDDSDFRYEFVQKECLRAIGRIGSPYTIVSSTPIEEIGRLEEDLVRSLITPVLIRKFEDKYLKEEICGAIGSLRISECRDLLFKGSKDEHKGIRSAALKSLVQLSLADSLSGPDRIRAVKADEVMLALLAASSKDPSTEIRAIAVEALGKSGDDRAVNPLIERLNDQDKNIREKAIEGLGRFSDEKILGAVIPFLDSRVAENSFLSVAKKTARGSVDSCIQNGLRHVSKDWADLPEAAVYQRLIVHPFAVEKLLDALHAQRDPVRVAAVQLTRKFEDQRIEPQLLQLLNDETPGVRIAAAARLLHDFPSKSSTQLSIQALAKTVGKDRNRIHDATQSLESFERSDLLNELTHCLAQSDLEIRKGALLLLKEFGDDRALEALKNVSKDPDPQIAEEAKRLISDIKAGRTKAMASAHMPGPRLKPPPIIRITKKGTRLLTVVTSSDKTLPQMPTEILARSLKNEDPGVRRSAARLLALREGDPNVVRSLIPVLRDPHESVREEAAKSLGKLKAKDAVGPIVEALNDPNTEVSAALIWAVGEIRDPEAVKRLVPLLSDREEEIRSSCFDAFQKLEDPGTKIALFASACKHENENVRAEAAERLGYMGDAKALPLLVDLLKDKNKLVRQAASWGLGNLGAKEAVTPIIEKLNDPDLDVRVALIWALGVLNDAGAVETLQSLLWDKEGRVSSTAAQALARIQSKAAEEALLDALREDRDTKLRVQVTDALGETGHARAVPDLVLLLKHENEYLRQAAARALGSLRAGEAVGPLIETLKDTDSNVLAWSIWALGEINDPRSFHPLTPFLFAKEHKLRDRSFEALLKFRDPDFRNLLVLRLFERAKRSDDWSAGGMLRKLASQEGDTVILRAFDDPGRDEAKTVRNYVDLMETNVLLVSDLATKALENHKNKELVIRELNAAPHSQRRNLLKNRLLSSTPGEERHP
jgi:HEAT repeat protein